MIPHGLCVGLDIDISRLPRGFSGVESIVAFNRRIIEATRPFASAFKANAAFYERYGRAGIDALYQTRDLVGDSFFIYDAKRGDIGNTSDAYAHSAFVDLAADAITVTPYMGEDSIRPFLKFPGKAVFVLALTSNKGSSDFQRQDVLGKPLYQLVIERTLGWAAESDLGFVIGATHPAELREVRSLYPDLPFLIPGIGAQGGSAAETAESNGNGTALFNVSRGIIYAGSDDDFAEVAGREASRLGTELNVRR